MIRAIVTKSSMREPLLAPMVIEVFRRDMLRLPTNAKYQFLVAIYTEPSLYWHYVLIARDHRHARDLAVAAVTEFEYGVAEICVVGYCTDRSCPSCGELEDRTFFEFVDKDGDRPR